MALTERQKDIVELVKHGKSNAYIANKLSFGIRTVERELTELFISFGVENRTSLVTQILKYENRGYCDF